MKLLSTTLLGLIFVGALVATDGQATVIYEQPLLADGSSARSGGTRVALDDFRLTEASSVTSIEWYGSTRGTQNQFQIGFHAGSSGSSNLPVLTPFFSATVTSVSSPVAGANSLLHYTANLDVGVFLEAGTTYWLSIQNAGTSFINGFWGWAGSGSGRSVSFGPPRNSIRPSDLAFTLNATTVEVPEPATLSLFGLGLIGLSVTRLRRRRGLQA